MQDKSRGYYWEVFLASTCGAAAGLGLALYNAWHPLWAIPCAAISPLFVRPWEILATIGGLLMDWFTAARGLRLGQVKKFMFATACALIAGVSLSIVPAAAWLTVGLLSAPADAQGQVIFVTPITGFLASCFGAIFLLATLATSALDGRWKMPICRRLVEAMGRRWDEQAVQRLLSIEGGNATRKTLLFCVVVPLFSQLCLLLVVLLVIDFVFTIILACATTQRIGAFVGGTAGALVGALLHMQSGWTPLTIAGGALTGGFIGKYVCKLQHYLAQPLATEAAPQTTS